MILHSMIILHVLVNVSVKNILIPCILSLHAIMLTFSCANIYQLVIINDILEAL